MVGGMEFDEVDAPTSVTTSVSIEGVTPSVMDTSVVPQCIASVPPVALSVGIDHVNTSVNGAGVIGVARRI